jgi:hypothetical protein
MVDQALRTLGVDPADSIDAEGWRHLRLGSAHGLINVIEWEPGLHFLVAWSPILRAPEDPGLRAQLFELLIRLNHHETGMARFSLMGEMVVLSFVRPVHGLDLDEVLDVLQTVMSVADDLDDRLQIAFEIEMPRIEMDDETRQGIADVMRLCDRRTQVVFRLLMEGWAARKGMVEVGKSNVGLRSRSPGHRSLAALVGYAAAGPLVTVGWDSLERVWGVQPRDAQRFKKAVPRPARFQTTQSSAHLPVDDSFTEAMVDQLLNALDALDRALKRAVPPKEKPLPDLEDAWGLQIQVGGATHRNVDALLKACPSAVQAVYARLIQGWQDAGQQLYTNKADRVYLRLTVDDHTFSLCTLYGPQKEREPRIELDYPLFYYFDAHLEARRRYEGSVAHVPGFAVHNSGARIPMGGDASTEDADKLLRVLRRLAEDVAR